MQSNGMTSIDRAGHTANAWLADVAEQFGTDDRQFVYRVTRTWLHTLRDRLPTNTSAHFAAQLPELLRGVYYDGWDPTKVPEKYHRDEYLRRFAAEARIPVTEVPKAARMVSAALAKRVSPGSVATVLGLLPGDLRELIQPRSSHPATADPAPATRGGETVEARLARLEESVRTLTEALRILTEGLEEVPVSEPSPERGAKAARLAHEVLLTVPAEVRR